MNIEAITRGPALRRILVVNPNGNPDVTARVQRTANGVIGNGCIAVAVNPADSPRSIETPEDRRNAEPEAIKLLSQSPGFDAYVMACFDDIAIKEGRRILTAPIVNTVEASVSFARTLAKRFAIVTTVDTMVPGICGLLETLGAAKQCTVRAAGTSVAAAASDDADSDWLLDQTIRQARDADGAGAIILGSGGLTGKARILADRHRIPVIDCIEAGVLMAEAASRFRVPSDG